MNLLELKSIPWMKHRIEALYNTKITGNLYVLYLNQKSENLNIEDYTASYIIEKLFSENNIDVDSINPLYCYFPLNSNQVSKDLAVGIKDVFKDNCKILLGSYDEDKNVEDICYKPLENIAYGNYHIQKNNSYELFTSIYDTQSIKIDLDSSVSLCGCIENNIQSKNATHVAFINLFDSNLNGDFLDSYLKGLVTTNTLLGYSL